MTALWVMALASIELHVSEPSYDGCAHASVQDTELSCDTIRTDAPRDDTPRFAWVVVAGLDDGIESVGFGICYDPTVNIVAWSACVSGIELPETDGRVWPQPGSGDELHWRDGCYVPENADDMTRVGFFHVMPQSRGRLRVIADPRSGEAAITTCDGERRTVCPARGGVVEFGGVGPAPACAAIDCSGVDEWPACEVVPTQLAHWHELKSAFR